MLEGWPTHGHQVPAPIKSYYHHKGELAIDLMKLNELTVVQLIELLILSQLVNSTNNNGARRKALKDGLNLKRFLDHARTCEQTEHQWQIMDSRPSESVNFMRKNKKADNHNKAGKGMGKQKQFKKQSQGSGKCEY